MHQFILYMFKAAAIPITLRRYFSPAGHHTELAFRNIRFQLEHYPELAFRYIFLLAVALSNHHRHHQLEPGLLDLAVDSHPGHPHPPLVAPNLGSLCLRACIRVCVHARVYGCEYRSLKK